jgi:hypothetical protein
MGKKRGMSLMFGDQHQFELTDEQKKALKLQQGIKEIREGKSQGLNTSPMFRVK